MKNIVPLLALLGAVAGCGPKRESTIKGPAPALATHFHGFWAGKAIVSPCGKMPYALAFDADGADVVAETPPTLGDETLPPGSYQRFVFQGGRDAKSLSYKTAMGTSGFAEGILELDQERSSPTSRRYCEPHACEKYELRWESKGPRSLSIQVWMNETLHADIALEFEGDR